jgi:hypothetical protein
MSRTITKKSLRAAIVIAALLVKTVASQSVVGDALLRKSRSAVATTSFQQVRNNMTTNDQLPETISAFIKANNDHDGARFMSFFSADALVNDSQRNFWATDAIKGWADKEIIGDRVTMEVRQVIHHYNDWIVTAKIDGNYDKTKAPDPLYLDYHFTLYNDRIVKLTIIVNRAFQDRKQKGKS